MCFIFVCLCERIFDYDFEFFGINSFIQMCEAIDSSVTGKNTLEKLYDAASIYYNYSGTSKCFDLNDHSDPHDLGGWQWQVLSYSISIPRGLCKKFLLNKFCFF